MFNILWSTSLLSSPVVFFIYLYFNPFWFMKKIIFTIKLLSLLRQYIKMVLMFFLIKFITIFYSVFFCFISCLKFDFASIIQKQLLLTITTFSGLSLIKYCLIILLFKHSPYVYTSPSSYLDGFFCIPIIFFNEFSIKL